MFRFSILKLAAAAGLILAGPVLAQVTPIDPNEADRYQSAVDPAIPPAPPPPSEPVDPGSQDPYQPIGPTPSAPTPVTPTQTTPTAPDDTIPRKDIFSAAEGVFGTGAKGLAQLLEKILKEQGEPTAYIAGQEAGGALVVGLRYGSGTMRHKIEGDRPIYWTGPSVGFDAGGDANKVFVLVYNLHDTQDLYRRFPAAEGNAYVFGGFSATYLRRGNIVLIPIRLGVGMRLGVNAGYMKFSEKNRWLPF